MMMLVMTVLRTSRSLPYPAKVQGGVGETEEISDGPCADEPSNLHLSLRARGKPTTPRLLGDPQVNAAHVPYPQPFGNTHRLLQRQEETA